MEIIGKFFWFIKVIGFVFLCWKYGLDGFNNYSLDFDNNVESVFAFIAGSAVGISEIFNTYQSDLTGLFFLMVTSLLITIIKALLTVLITFYFTKFLKNPPKGIEWIKNIFIKKKNKR
jgi:Na+/glutamate symporter